MTMETFLKLLPTLLTGALFVAGALGLGIMLRGKLSAWADWLAAKTHLAKLANLDDMLWAFLKDTAHELDAPLRDALADGKLDKAERDRLVQIVVIKAKSHFGLTWLKGFVADVGMDAVDSFVRGRTHKVLSERAAEEQAALAQTTPGKA